MSYKEDTRRFNEMAKHRVRCKCSHTMIMTNADRTICSYCGKWVYRTPIIEFKYKLRGSMKKKEVMNEKEDRRFG